MTALKDTELAILFHDTYERLAPSFGYETRDDTKVFDQTSKNGKLMVAVAHEINQAITLHTQKREAVALEFAKEQVNKLRDVYLTQENLPSGSDPLAEKAIAIRNKLRQDINAELDERISQLTNPTERSE